MDSSPGDGLESSPAPSIQRYSPEGWTEPTDSLESLEQEWRELALPSLTTIFVTPSPRFGQSDEGTREFVTARTNIISEDREDNLSALNQIGRIEDITMIKVDAYFYFRWGC